MDRFMEEALAQAAKGAGQTSPNPTVGAVVVRDETVIGRGHHIWER
jgi:diaminohydroxyphosphoribosylaminopyrimidine deaminase / 5-amino-6-(5-phosphoribosylamino)uracil reductase